MITLLFYTEAKFKECSAHSGELTTKVDYRIKRMFKLVSDTLSKHWIETFFSPIFGYPEGNKLTMATKEIKVD